MGKEFHLKLTARVPAGWGSASLVSGRPQWRSLCASLLAEVIFGFSAAKAVEDLGVAVAARAVIVLRGEGCRCPLFLYAPGEMFYLSGPLLVPGLV